MARRPAGGVREHAYTVKHDTDGECIVRCTGTRQGAIEVLSRCALTSTAWFFPSGVAVGHAYDDVGEVGVRLVKSFAHHVEPGK